ncbi:D-2-hydroxyacid dehydrogenase [Sulfurospirillum diekertiae]|uniref:2-hydroxyacid dehydrogenase n=1 Tax=Sulfurospirillum diekertiae TaxID=1854492 RepID=A0A1Y0HGN5_9BACT|nr:D-2-hydroxyacid dehydrogenase [Sulfurospirillum diekertiae]ARU47218.1 Putative 2-hydroxyacid dehydrogenase [Sulfurospirillum diekertiae]ASC92072.1 Putative 2-hydroxyacid dehydrogenase [Sulfurospirillum diekertiae]
MKIVFLDAQTMGKDMDLSLFESFGEFHTYETTSPSECALHIADANIVLTNKVVIDKAVMDACPNLQLICVTATGTNNVDLVYASEKGIVVKNVAGYSTASVAQTTIMLALSLISHCRYYDDFVKKGGWVEAPTFTHIERPFWEIKGKRWGIIGLGTIGKEVAKIATAFGAEVVYYSTSGANNDALYQRVSLEEMLQTCSIISIHAPLNAQTKGLIDETALREMKEGSILVNVGRGGLIDEIALAKVIDEKELYVGLDVLEAEPMQKGHPLLNVKHQERLIVTPHIAWSSIEARTSLMRLVAQNIQTFLNY